MAASGVAKVGTRLVFFGAPGVGKGTYASRIAPLLDIPTISTGDIVRAEIAADSDIGKQVRELNDKGQLVPDDIVTAMVKKRLAEADAQKGYILDGYPRTVQQAKDLAEFQDVQCVVNLSLPDDILVAKLMGRRMCKDCGRNYNVTEIKEAGYEMPPLLPKASDCEQCKGEPNLFTRADDNEETIRSRLQVYKQHTAPVVDFYRGSGVVLDFEVKKGLQDMPRLLDDMGVPQEAR